MEDWELAFRAAKTMEELTAAGGMLAEAVPEDAFLAGGERDLDVDTIFGKDFSVVLAEMRQWSPEALLPEPDSVPIPLAADPAYTVRSLEGGIGLYDSSGTLVGGYLSCDLSIEDEHQGIGLGREIVACAFLKNHELPTWHLDAPAYSPAGEATHRAAWRLLTGSPEWTQRVMRLLDTNEVMQEAIDDRPNSHTAPNM